MRYFTPLIFVFSLMCHAQWNQLPDFPGTARDDAASFTIAGKIYVGTGREVGFGYTDDWYCYDPGNESWSQIATMPASPRQYCTAFTIADTGYVFGGTNDSGPSNELWAYHPGTDQWEQKAALPAAARYACVGIGMMWNDALIATGMLADGIPTNEAWKYNATTDSWSATGNVPGPPRHRAACVQGNGGGMVLIGGADSAYVGMRDVWEYPSAFETGTWYERDSIPEARWGADGSGSYVYVVACGATEQSVFHADVWGGYTLTEPLPAFPAGVRRGGVGAGITGPQNWSNTFYYGLGLDGDIMRRNDWWRLDMVVGIEEQDPITTFTLYPIPSNTEITVALHPRAIGAFITCTSMDGRVISDHRAEDATLSINTANFANGAYMLTLRTASGNSNQRFVVQH